MLQLIQSLPYFQCSMSRVYQLFFLYRLDIIDLTAGNPLDFLSAKSRQDDTAKLFLLHVFCQAQNRLVPAVHI